MFLYCTADKIGDQSGGGVVTANEWKAFSSLGNEGEGWGRDQFEDVNGDDPWKWDDFLFENLKSFVPKESFKLAHFYAGTWTKTITKLKEAGCKISYTAAAHDVAVSKREHEKLGLSYNYPHLTDPELWKRYVGGYLMADVLICPSNHSAKVMRGFGYKGRIEIIPHGCEIPKEVKPLPEKFTLGYMGAVGPDKGLVYLLRAWKKLNYKDASLVLAGRDSQSGFVRSMLEHCGLWGGDCPLVVLRGWVDNVSDFYNSISAYCQPSASEGFGCEVLEAMSYSRPVICSDGAGACDLVDPFYRVPACDVDALANKIDEVKKAGVAEWGNKNTAEMYTWDRIRQRYIDVWKGMIQ